jgi:cell division protein FtsQ
MSKKGKKILVSFFVILFLIALIIGSNIFIGNQDVQRVDMKISYGKSDTIILPQQINSSLNNVFDNFLKLKRKEVDIRKIEAFLLSKPYVQKAQVYQTLKGVLNIEITQREPILRINTLKGLQYYVDNHGKIIPITNFESTDVIIANGNVDILANVSKTLQLDTNNIEQKKGYDKTLSKLYLIAQKISNDTILNYQIDQLFVTNEKDIELIPKIGNYIIRIGDVNEIDEELTKLKYLYKEGFSRNGWDNYSIVDLRFRNQVVCTKKDVMNVQ